MSATGLTAALGNFAATSWTGSVPKAGFDAVRLAMSDFGACVMLGRRRPVTEAIRATLPTRGGNTEAHLYFGREQASARDAALANGAAAHASNIDDNALRNSHVSSVLAAAVLAEGEAIGASGARIAAAYCVGYEVWARLVDCESDAYIDKGWHPTPVLGPLAAAATIANLHGCDAAIATSAIGIAASFAGGLVANFNEWVKPYQVGRASAGGIEAVRLAIAGLRGSPQAVEAKNGLIAVLSPRGKFSCEGENDLGHAWRIERFGVNLKRYPNAAITHRALDGIFSILVHQPIDPASVARVEVYASSAQPKLAEPTPISGEGLHKLRSIELAMTGAIIARRMTSAELATAFYQTQAAQDLMAKIVIVVSDEGPPDREPGLGFRGRVKVVLRSGETFESADAPVARGHWTSPFSEAEAWEKFAGGAIPELGERTARDLFDMLFHIDELDNLRRLNAVALQHADA